MTETPEEILDRLGTTEHRSGKSGKRERANGHADSPSTSGGVGMWCAADDKDYQIPPRGWLLGNVFCRRFVSSLLAVGSTGKTALRILQALSLATGRPLTGEHVFLRCRVLIISLEDDAEELRRRIRAALLHYDISYDETQDWLFLATPASMGWKLAALNGDVVELGELAARIRNDIKRAKLDLVIVDPFVKSHAVPENDNRQIDMVVNILASIAIDCDCAIDSPHHLNKGTPEPGNADKGRGASAFKEGARLVYTLTTMAKEEAEQHGISEEDRPMYIRVDSGKVNITRASRAKWFKLIGVPIGNPTDIYPEGDSVPTVEPWTPPDLWEGLSNYTANQILDVIDKGLPDGRRFSDYHLAGADIAAWKVVQQFAPDKTDKQAKQIVREWVRNDVLTVEEYQNPKRRQASKGVKVNPAKRRT